MSRRINPKNIIEVITGYAAYEAQGVVDTGGIPEDEQDAYHDVLVEEAQDLMDELLAEAEKRGAVKALRGFAFDLGTKAAEPWNRYTPAINAARDRADQIEWQ